MKKLKIKVKDCKEDFELLEKTLHDIDVLDSGNFWLADYETHCRVLVDNDILVLTVTAEQETFLKIRFGDKISDLE